jgi:nitroreductase
LIRSYFSDILKEKPFRRDLMDAIFHRISVWKYQQRPMKPEKLRRILKAAIAAPSAGNQQP